MKFVSLLQLNQDLKKEKNIKKNTKSSRKKKVFILLEILVQHQYECDRKH